MLQDVGRWAKDLRPRGPATKVLKWGTRIAISVCVSEGERGKSLRRSKFLYVAQTYELTVHVGQLACGLRSQSL